MKYITQEGLEKAKTELEKRKRVTRREVASAIKEAKEQGDLSENAEYTEAKRQQRENEGRIIQLENIIRTSEVVTNNGNKDIVSIGSEIEVENAGKKMFFHIVGSNEADPLKGKISNESPIGRAFLGKKKGEEFKVTLPNRNIVEYKIVDIK
ncbi:transcription elongation factor GreA [bacterium]|jgi:transcription elongation factor GreA|nr:transcription elongation factor GreA [bacterium]MBT6753837.1 transcription elongation factor GreA [bacterium]MBT7037451.1 transcription elongation factor GreA [bacterium]